MGNAVAAQPKTDAEFFLENGYLIPEDVDVAADEAVAAIAQRLGATGRVTDAWRRERAVRDLACHPTILATLAELFGADMAPFQTLNFARGTEQPVHTDSMFFDTEPGGMMAGVWVALEDIDADNGPLMFYPGSHRLPRLTPAELGIRCHRGLRYDDTLSPHLTDNLKARGLTPAFAHLRKGQALIWHANLAHGGALIRDRSRTRHSQVTHYFARGLRYVQPISGTAKQPTDIRTGRRFGAAPVATAVREAAKNVLRWAPRGN